MKLRITKILSGVAGIFLSGGLYYLSNGFTGGYAYLLWLAPLPVLLLALRTKPWQAFTLAFLAFSLGRMSWFSFLVALTSTGQALLSIFSASLVFAVIVGLTRRVVLKTGRWYSVFAFPAFFTTFEYLFFTFSYNGTYGSIAYTQAQVLPLIQLASVTGILGITFVVTFIPSALALAWHFRRSKPDLLPLGITGVSLVAAVFLFGALRLSGDRPESLIKVGLATLEEKQYRADDSGFQEDMQQVQQDASLVDSLSALGARLVLLPERSLNVNKLSYMATVNLLTRTARQNQVALIAGYTVFANQYRQNAALVIDASGKMVGSYYKVHLVKGFEDQFTPGKTIGLFAFDGQAAGVAICKDLDYPGFIRQYGEKKVAFLCVPAWDFVTDGWLHARMAVLRGVENGFSVVRAARLGRLTISDPYGRVIAEARTENGHPTTLLGNLPLYHLHTLYARFGGAWFGLLMTAVSALWILMTVIKRKE